MNRKRVIFSSLCVILLVALVGGTLSWFYVNEEVSVTYGSSIFCEAGDSLEIALVDENGNAGRWSSLVDYSPGNYTTVDISGDGVTLFKPKEVDENRNPVDLAPAVSSRENNLKYDYVEMEVAFRSTSAMNVYLSEESFINPVIKEGDAEANIYGNFSRGYIAGAMRVAIVDDDGLRMLWAPNSKYHLYMNAQGTYSFNPDSTPEENYYYYAEETNEEDATTAIVQKTVSEEMYASKTFVVDSTGANKETSGNSPVLVSLNPENLGAHDEKRVKIRIWFEGTDREAHQALAGGNVSVKLKFVGIAKETNQNQQNAIDNITYNNNSFSGLADGMVFSYDGTNWTDYKPGVSEPKLTESGTTVYIKYPETATYRETDYAKFTKD